MELKKATRVKEKLRLGLAGPSGSGKTYSALKVAKGLASSWDKVAIIDTEHGSGNLYADLGDYNHLELLPPFTPELYIEAIDTCINAGMECIVIDSISHEWEGQGGILEISNSMTGNSFTNWAKLTPRHNKFIDRILSSPTHMICCLRTKTEYALTKETNWKGKEVDVPKKIGLKANTREGFDYEMTVAFDIEHKTHYAATSKDRTRVFENMHELVLSEEHGELLLTWMNQGSESTLPNVQDIKKETGLKTANEILQPPKLTKDQQEMIDLRGKHNALLIEANKQNLSPQTILEATGYLFPIKNGVDVMTFNDALTRLDELLHPEEYEESDYHEEHFEPLTDMESHIASIR